VAHQLLAFPFRLGPNRTVATVDQDTPDADGQQVAVLVLTLKGERPLVPGFGITDPSFSLGGLEIAEVRAGVDQFGPEVDIESVTDSFKDPTQYVQIRLGRSKEQAA
jgi:hypothetical protein